MTRAIECNTDHAPEGMARGTIVATLTADADEVEALISLRDAYQACDLRVVTL